MNWLLIGASNVAQEWIVDAIRSVGDEVTGLVSGSRERGTEFAKRNNIPIVTTEIHEALQDKTYDAVYISTTNEKHFDEAMLALGHGKHVMCEKPMALDVEEASAMIDEAVLRKKTLGVNYHLRNSAVIQKMRDVIRDGMLGKILTVRFCHAVALPEKLQGWRVGSGDGNGVVMDITVHDIDTLRFLLDDEPVAVSAMSQTGLLSKSGSDETVMGTIRFAEGTLVSFYDSFTANHFETSIDIIGSEGTLRARNVLTQNPVGEVTLHNRDGALKLEIEHSNLYKNSFNAFRQAVMTGNQPAADGYDGLRSLQVSLLVSQAVKTGMTVDIPQGL